MTKRTRPPSEEFDEQQHTETDGEPLPEPGSGVATAEEMARALASLTEGQDVDVAEEGSVDPEVGETPAADDEPGALLDPTPDADPTVRVAVGEPDGAVAAASAPPAHERLVSILESLLLASDRPLRSADLATLVGERDIKVVGEALGLLEQHYAGRGLRLVQVAGGWQMRTAPENAAWVQRLVAGKPVRLSRAQLETLAIVAYRQPITRPEIDEIRGVDSGAVLRVLLERNLLRILGKKEEPGRPLLYGTSREFLEFFHLRDLRDLPTLREFHELTEEHRAEVDALGEGAAGGAEVIDVRGPEPSGPSRVEPASSMRPTASELPVIDPEEEAALLEDLAAAERAAEAAVAPLRVGHSSGDTEPGADPTEPGATGPVGGRPEE